MTMNTKRNQDYLTPAVSVLNVDHRGVLCSSTEFGTGTTDNFTMGEDISDIF